jgi:hypothetical protein
MARVCQTLFRIYREVAALASRVFQTEQFSGSLPVIIFSR